jgi:hypothetical protein
MSYNANLATARGRRQVLSKLVSACRSGDQIPHGLASDEHGLVATIFTAKPDNRLYYLERVTADEIEGVRAMVIRPNRTRRISQNPMKLAQGELYETTASPHVFIHSFPTEPLLAFTDIRQVRRWVLERLHHGNPQSLIERQQVRSDQELLRIYSRYFQ